MSIFLFLLCRTRKFCMHACHEKNLLADLLHEMNFKCKKNIFRRKNVSCLDRSCDDASFTPLQHTSILKYITSPFLQSTRSCTLRSDIHSSNIYLGDAPFLNLARQDTFDRSRPLLDKRYIFTPIKEYSHRSFDL